MSTVRVAIAGATGYAGEELIRLLLGHPHVRLTHLAASAKWDRPIPASEVYPRFARELDLPITALEPTSLAEQCDVAFLALPHGVSMHVAPTLLGAERKVIDLAGDFRLKDPAAFHRWYHLAHAHPELLHDAVYGACELFAPAIRRARLLANPGCYATSVTLALAPLLRAGLIEPQPIIIDAKSGWSGAGRQTVEGWERTGRLGDLWPYKVNSHQHMPEVEQALSAATGTASSLTFVPHVVPMERGMISTMYLRTTNPVTWQDADRCYREAYREAPFVRLRPKDEWPSAREVAGTNYCDLAFGEGTDQRLLIVVAAIDNLMKGAAGQALQNLNLMCGWSETTGLV